MQNEIKKYLSIFCRASIFYVLIRFVLWLLQIENRAISDLINYHHSIDLFWKTIWYFIPIVVSILLGIGFKTKFLSQLGYFLLPILIIGTIIIGKKNKDYWGYYFKRPSLFAEIRKSDELVSITPIQRYVDTLYSGLVDSTYNTDLIYGRQDPYYGSADRAIMEFEDRASDPQNMNFFQWDELMKDSLKKISSERLKEIEKLLTESDLFPIPGKGYEKTGIIYRGNLVEFKSKNIQYEYIYLRSEEVANDHFANCEFLIESGNKEKIESKQIFFTDFAGYEGMEYCNIFGIFEIALLLISLILLAITRLIKYIIKKKTG